MNKKSFISLLIILSTILTIYTTASADPTPSPAPSPTPAAVIQSPADFPEIHAEAGILMDLKTGRVLYSKNPNEKLYPASTTKILTAIIALERGTLTDVVTASQEAIAPITLEDSHMGILVGEQLTMEQLINGMLIYSANDAANVVAVHIAGSIDAFAKIMNEKAKEIGAVNSNFVNPHGFHDDNHYTTAHDLAAIARYAMSNEKFREIVKTQRYTIPPTNKYKTERILTSTNHLISKFRNAYHYYTPAIGIKTGYTSQAGNCLVAAAQKDNTEFLSVLMKCANVNAKDTAYSFVDTKAMFEYGFKNYKYQTLAAPGDVVSDSSVYEAKGGTRVALTVENDIAALLPITLNKDTEIKIETKLNDKITAPIAKGTAMGTISYMYNNEQIGTTNLVASNDVQRDIILFIIHMIIKVVTSPFFLIPLVLIIILIIYLRIQNKKKRNRRRNRLSYPKYR